MSFIPTNALRMIHDSFRFSGSNQITLSGLTDGTLSDQSMDYITGVSTTPAIMILLFIIWLIVLCVSIKCKLPFGRDYISILFGFVMVLSSVGWIISISGVNQTTGGSTTVFDHVSQLLDEIDDTLDYANEIVEAIVDFGVFSDYASTSCSSVLSITNDTFPSVDTSDFAQSTNDTINSISGDLNSITNEVESVIDNVKSYISTFKTIYTIVVSLVVTLVLFFSFTTFSRIYMKENALSKFAGKLGAIFFYTVGIILLLILWILMAVLIILTTVGSDFCTPGPNVTFERILIDLFNKTCADDPFSYICYYQTCLGNDPLGTYVSEIDSLTENMTTQIIDLFTEVNQTINTYNVSAYECQTNLTMLVHEVQNIDYAIGNTTSIVECTTINPFYTGIVYDGICNGLVHGLIITWVGFSLGGISLMCGLIIYCSFNFEVKQYLKLENEVPKEIGNPFTIR